MQSVGGPSKVQFLGQNNDCAQVDVLQRWATLLDASFSPRRQKSHRHTSAGTAPDHSCHNVAATKLISFLIMGGAISRALSANQATVGPFGGNHSRPVQHHSALLADEMVVEIPTSNHSFPVRNTDAGGGAGRYRDNIPLAS